MNNSGIIASIVIILVIVGLLLTVTGLISYISFSDKGLEVTKMPESSNTNDNSNSNLNSTNQSQVQDSDYIVFQTNSSS